MDKSEIRKAITKLREEIIRIIAINTMNSERSPVKEVVETLQQDIVVVNDLRIGLMISVDVFERELREIIQESN